MSHLTSDEYNVKETMQLYLSVNLDVSCWHNFDEVLVHSRICAHISINNSTRDTVQQVHKYPLKCLEIHLNT